MEVSGRIAREVLDAAIRIVRPGIMTDAIDQVVHAETIARNSYPSPLNYHNFPKSCCTSVNEIICHGIPDTTMLLEGDIVNIDVTVFHDGVHGDCSETVFVGQVSPQVRDLVVTTYEAWQAAIDFCQPGRKYSDIGGIIEDIIKPKGYSTVKEFCGHGIGRVFHSYPNVLHYKNSQKSGVMEEGHTFTIEPMICMGSSKPFLWGDDWTAATSDGQPTAQFEHTLLITKDGVKALTAKLPDSPKYSWEL
ncbi:peptidase M24, structural domain-containing protein [Ochromonadaceae sp. CCMP2298]|nr:peptidase M24, structural domain-containing protein [Ochromonadaceae sp. CCMP2298]